MTFTVTYRGADGSVREERVEAAGRGECFAQMKARGIAPLSVKECARSGKGGAASRVGAGAKPSAAKERAKSPSVALKTLLAAAVMLILAGGVWWWRASTEARPHENVPEVPKKAALPKKVAPAPVAKVSAPTNSVAAAQTNEVVVAERKPKERHDTVSIHTNNLGKVVEKWIGPDGNLHMSVRYARKPVFDNASDDQLAMAVGGGGTQSIPPIPMTAASEQEFLESLKKPIVIADDDPENVKRIKQAVKEAREAMKQLMDGGMSYREALAEHQKLVNENVDTRNQCMAELKSLVEAGDCEGAKQYLKTMNIALEQMGIPALTMPMSREELNAARQRRREEREAAKRKQP